MPRSLFLSVLYQVLIVSLSHLLFPGHPLLMLYRMLKGRGGGREGGRGREREGGREGGRKGKKEIIHFKVKKRHVRLIIKGCGNNQIFKTRTYTK